MPVALPAEALDLLAALAAPLEQERRPAFLAAVAAEIEASSAIGPGVVHQIGRRLQPRFFDAPHDSRVGTNQRRA
jgi:hypothetical protein